MSSETVAAVYAKSGTETELTAVTFRIRQVAAVNSVSVPDFA